MSERSWDTDRLHEDGVKEILVENMRGAAVHHIGYVRMNGRKSRCKPQWNKENREAEREYHNAWENNTGQQRQTKADDYTCKGQCEKSVIQTLREKGMEGSHEWCRFLRGEDMPDSEDVQCLKVNGKIITEREKIRDFVKEFWEEIGRVSEVFEVRERCK